MDSALKAEIAMLSHQKDLAYATDKALERGDSSIQQFYNNAVVFVTGGSGFLGKLLVEKLFRSCNIKKIYLLIRVKKGKNADERLEQVLSDSLFDTVRKTKPDFSQRIVTINGDVSELKLGISDEDWKKVTSEVDIIFHLAATTRFNEALKLATFINVRGAREVLKLATECSNLRSYVHVSTAYANATLGRRSQVVLDQLYPPPVPPHTLIELAETVDEDILDRITANMTKGWPNTYTFTKNVAEDLVRIYGRDLPVCIVRPSIVTPTNLEPTPGWLDMSCIYSLSGQIAGVGLGIVRVFTMDSNKFISLVPGDVVNNATIAAGWKTGVKERQSPREIDVYTASCIENPITGGQLASHLRYTAHRFPTPKAIWALFFVMIKSEVLHTILSWFLHDIPAYIVDAVCTLIGKKPMFRDMYKKISKQTQELKFFAVNEWFFEKESLPRLSKGMSDSDKKIFNFDVKNIKWNEYAIIWVIGIRKYVLKDGLKDTESAVRKQFWLKIANYLVIALYAYCIWKIVYFVSKVLMFWL